jgi:hypothetical protein
MEFTEQRAAAGYGRHAHIRNLPATIEIQNFDGLSMVSSNSNNRFIGQVYAATEVQLDETCY